MVPAIGRGRPGIAAGRTWFEAGIACIGMGSQLLRPALIKQGQFDAIAEQTAATLALIQCIRGRRHRAGLPAGPNRL
jgi:2-dehydro-3-deoxyphosphogluconate aldolase/(4S)-4-hydroxy-2-oxoglutarate aldolase